jgi:hypothetical protein
MKPAATFETLKRELAATLSAKFPGISIEVAHSAKWNRPCVTFTSRDFANLLPEERFHRLVAAIPTEFREQKMAGFVWLELAEGETVEKFLKLPRSEDIADREAEIYGQLASAKFFDSLAESMGTSPDKRCGGDFRELIRILSARKLSAENVRDARLLMIRYRAYCDCQILLTAMPELARLFANAA